jgi:hypothetical protein
MLGLIQILRVAREVVQPSINQAPSRNIMFDLRA